MSNEISFEKNGTNVSVVVDCTADMKPIDDKKFRASFEASDYYDHFLFEDYLGECIGDLNDLIQDIKEEKKSNLMSKVIFIRKMLYNLIKAVV